MRRILSVVVGLAISAFLLVGLAPEADAATKLYWSDGGNIRRANLDGTGVEDLFNGVSAQGLAIDSSGGKVYFAGFFKLRRGNITGGGLQDLVSGPEPIRVALDLQAGKLYWGDSSGGKIQRSNLDGSGGAEDLVTGLNQPVGVAVDPYGGKVYWTDESDLKIQRADLDGSNVEDLVTAGFIAGTGIALDLVRGKMYWSDASGKISRANLDGSGVQDLVNLSNARDVALDVAAGKVYWSDVDTEKIQRANLDGSGVEDLVTNIANVDGIALDLGGAGAMTIFPPTSTMTTTMGFDLGFITETPGRNAVGGAVFFNGIDVGNTVAACAVSGTLSSGGGQTFRCPGVTGGTLGPGTHTMAVVLRFDDGSSAMDIVTYKVLASTEP